MRARIKLTKVEEINPGYYELAGSIIHQAIDDWARLRYTNQNNETPKTRAFWTYDAEEFLFRGGLEKFVDRAGLSDYVNVPLIRKRALEAGRESSKQYKISRRANGKDVPNVRRGPATLVPSVLPASLQD